MSRLVANTSAPKLESLDFLGQPISLSAYQGRVVLLSFYRYASCPLCNMRMAELISSHERLSDQGLSIIAVFQSPASAIARYVGRQDAPFPIIADPEMIHYREWSVETSWSGAAKAAFARLGQVLRAFRGGYLPGAVEGPLHRMPADFLIAPSGIIDLAYYGKDVGDHVPLSLIEERLNILNNGHLRTGA